MDKFVHYLQFLLIESILILVICRPFVGPLYCTIKNARCVTLLIYVIGIFYAIPLMYEYEPHQDKTVFDILHVDIDNKNIYRSKLTDLGKNSIFRWTYVLINALTVCFIPLIIIGILNRKLFKSIRLLEQRSAEYNAPLPTKQGKSNPFLSSIYYSRPFELKYASPSSILSTSSCRYLRFHRINSLFVCLLGVTVMLLATTIMLLVFRSPATAIYIMWIIRAKMFINEKSPYPLRKFHSISNLCAIINAATTFIIFVIYGTKFRSEFTRVYCGIFTKSKQTKTESTIRQDQQQQQMKHFLSDHPEKSKESPNGRKAKRNLSLTDPSNGHCCVELLKDNSSATTSIRTSSMNPMKSLLKQRHERYSFDEEHDLMIKHKNKTRQNQLPIKEDESSDDHNTPKSDSYFNWFKNWSNCRHSS